MRIRKIAHPHDDSQERYLQDKLVIPAAERLGWRVFHVHDSRRSRAGFPDLVLVRGFRLIFAELKAPGKKPTPEQEEWLSALAVNAKCYVWRMADWDSGAIMEVLR